MDLGGAGWALQTIIGAAILAIVLFWAMRRNKKTTPEQESRTEDATRDLYRKEEAARADEDGDATP